MPVSSGGGGGSSSGAIRAGGAFVELFAKDAMLRKALDGAKKRLEGFGSWISGLGAKVGVMGGALFAPFAAAFKGGVDYAAQLDDLADSFGSTTEKLSPAAGAFKVAGLSLEDLGTAMKEVAKDGGAGPIEDQMDSLMQKLNEIEDPAERARFALDKFGKAGVKMAALAPDWDRLKASAPKVDSETAKKAEQFQQRIAAGLLALQVAMLPVLDLLTPLVDRVAKFLQENTEGVQIFGAVAAGLTAVGVALAVLGPAISALGVGIGVVSAGLGVIGSILGFLLSPIGAVTAAVVGLGAVFLTQTETGQQAASQIGGYFSATADRLKAGFMETAATAKQAFGGIVSAIKKGDIEGAFRIVVAFLRYEWAKVSNYWTTQWIEFKSLFVDGWHEVGFAFSSVWNSVTTGLETALRATLQVVIEMFNGAVRSLATAAAWLLDKVGLDETAAGLRNMEGVGTGWLNRWQQQIDKNHQAEEERIGRELNDKMEANRKFREQQGANSLQEMLNARQQFQDLINAQQENQKADAETYKPGGPDLAAIGPLADAVKGAFQSPNFSLSLGAADSISKKQLDVMERNAKATEQVAALMKTLDFARFK